MSALSTPLLILTILGTLYYVLSTAALIRRFAPRAAKGKAKSHVKISVLKPVRGMDGDARANFLTFLGQDYPDYEVLFGALDPDDAAIPLIRDVIKGDARASIYIGSEIDGFNNKVRILHNLARHSSGEILVITDADTQVTPDFLSRITAPLNDPQVGVTTCIYRGIGGRGMADSLEGLHMTCVFAPGVACADALAGIDFGLGAAIAIRRETLELIGGFESIVDCLADDFLLGRKSSLAGYKVKLSDYVIDIVLSGESLANVLRRELRWSVTTRVSRPVGHFGLIATFGLAYALILVMFDAALWPVLAAVTAIRWLTAYIGARICLQDRMFARRSWLLPIRDLLSFGIWVAGYFRQTVEWRGRHLELTRNGRITRVK
ncbi:MAG: bacteriohopanetetrol glucosamine biosynthesis glycosyltransferase HpnI [Armatimonadota bacterium]|nr:bacteriohopanetetrol glucosamine biosynthesis glycosyltransferase HpnI [bacterium]